MPKTLLDRRIQWTQIEAPSDKTTATDGNNTAVDTLGFTEALLLIDKGVVDDVTLNIDIQESDEATANFATVPVPVNTSINPRLLTFVNADDNIMSIAYLDLTALKRYIKPIDNLNVNSAMYGMTLLMFGPEAAPAAGASSTVEADAT